MRSESVPDVPFGQVDDVVAAGMTHSGEGVVFATDHDAGTARSGVSLERRIDSVGRAGDLETVVTEDKMESVTLRPTVVIADATKVDRTLRLLNKAESACLISRSVESRISLEPTVTVDHQVGT